MPSKSYIFVDSLPIACDNNYMQNTVRILFATKLKIVKLFLLDFSAPSNHTPVISAKFGLSTQNAKIRFFKSKYVEILQTKKCKKFVIKPVQSFYYTFLTWCYVLKMYLKWKKQSIKDSNNICICTIYLNIVQKVLKHFLL